MKTKQYLFYLVLAVAIAVVVVALERPERARVSDVDEGYFLPNYDSANVARIEVTQLMSGAELARKSDKWTVKDIVTPLKKDLLAKEGRGEEAPRQFLADPARVASALGALSGLESGVIVSTNPEKQASYQLNAAGLNVKGFDKDGKNIFDLTIGKNGPDFASNYIKRADSPNVYLVRRVLTGIFSPNADDWREKEAPALDNAPLTGGN